MLYERRSFVKVLPQSLKHGIVQNVLVCWNIKIDNN